MNHFVKKIYIPIYQKHLTIVLSEDVDKCNKLGYNGSDYIQSNWAHVLTDCYPIVLVLNFWDKTDKITHGLIAHECTHVTDEIFKLIKQEREYHSEPYCYLLQYIIDEVYKFMNDKKIIV